MTLAEVLIMRRVTRATAACPASRKLSRQFKRDVAEKGPAVRSARVTAAASPVIATRGMDGHRLAVAMAAALELGTTATANRIRKDRSAPVAELQRDGPEGESDIGRSLREQRLLRHVCASFTGAEIRDMCEGRGPALGRLPGAARERVRETMLGLHRDYEALGPVALAGAAGGARAVVRAGPRRRAGAGALHGRRDRSVVNGRSLGEILARQPS